jgi:DNA-directed RNA polymerase specialized sigma24 family protein
MTMIEQDEEAYELFRRAIVHRDENAWSAINAHYRPLLVSWASRCSAHASSGERADDIADQALARAWAALTPEGFVKFPSLARLLSYLRTCVVTTAIDSARSQAYSERIAQRLHSGAVATPEQIVLASLNREVLWRTVIALAATRAERVALVESLVYGLTPRAIWARHPQLFPDVAIVYSVKRNLFDRLQRNHDLLQLRDDFIS